MKLSSIFHDTHIYNVSAVEKAAGLRKLKLHEALNGRAKLTETELFNIQRVIKNKGKNKK